MVLSTKDGRTQAHRSGMFAMKLAEIPLFAGVGGKSKRKIFFSSVDRSHGRPQAGRSRAVAIMARIGTKGRVATSTFN